MRAIGLCPYPCRCLCLEFSQITRTTPLRWMILHLSQIFLTDALTFINQFSVLSSRFSVLSFSENRSASASPALRNLLVPIHNPTAIQVVWRKLDGDFVSRQYADEVLPHLPGNMRQHLVFVFQLHLEHGIRQRLDYNRHHFNRVLFTHRLL